PRLGRAVAGQLEIVRGAYAEFSFRRTAGVSRLSIGLFGRLTPTARPVIREAEQHPLGVLTVHVVQYVVGQADAVNVPEPLAVVATGAVEVLVVSLQEAVVHAVGVAPRRRVGAEKDPVPVLEEKPPGGVRLAAEFRNASAQIHVHI